MLDNLDNIWEWFCKISLVVVILICLNSLAGDLFFRCQYSFPILNSTSSEIIDTSKDPIQKNITKPKYIKARGEKNRYILEGMAEYTLSGLVVAKNNNFWFRDIMRSAFDDICLMDIGVAWGDLAADKNKLNKNIKFKSKKTLASARMLYWRGTVPLNNFPWSVDYVNSHHSHTHLIPANLNIMSALLTVKKWDKIKFEGYLVDIYTDKNEIVAKTSLSRFDRDATSRGYGACEDMYVTKVQINDKIYK